jgi:hypothetical protein
MNKIDRLFEILKKNNVHITRRTYNDDILEYNVWTSGYKTKECYDLEELFREYGFFALSMKFDLHCGKTRTHYKQVRKNN